MASSELFNQEAESMVLAAILRNPQDYWAINDIHLHPNDFIGNDARRIAKAMAESVNEKNEPSLTFVLEHLKSAGHDSSAEYASRLISIPCSVPQAHEYARTVKGLATSRNIAQTGARMIEIAREERSDSKSAIAKADALWRSVVSGAQVVERSPNPADILARMKSQGPAPSIPLYFSPTLQDITGGLHPGEMWVIGGFSSTGKSAVAVNLVVDILRARDKRVVIFNTEMTQETYMIRLMSALSGIPQRIIRDRVTIGHEQQELLSNAARYLRDSPWKVYDTIGNIQAIRTEATRLKNDEGLDVIVLDYIQSMDGGTGEEVRDARTIANVCQSMSKELDCTVAAFSQVSNSYAQDDNAAKGTGAYYAFKGHGAIRDNSDVSIMLRRDRKNQSPALKMSVEKNKNGELAQFTCHMDLPTGAIKEIMEEEIYDGRR